MRNISRNERRKCGRWWRECVNKKYGDNFSRSLEISESTRKLSHGELHYSFSSEYRKYSGGDTAFILSLFPSLSFSISISVSSLSLILLGPADSRMPVFPRAAPEKLWTRRVPGKERDQMCFTSVRPLYSRFRPALAQTHAITPIMEGRGP